jgi:hypothetical protein
MDPDHVAAQVRERSGLDVQAVTLVRSSAGDELLPWVWAAMTEYGHFWAVEDGENLELFRAVTRRTSPDDLLSCHSAVEAARRFLQLHPRPVETPAPVEDRAGSPDDGRALAKTVEAGEVCQACGTTFTRRRHNGQVNAGRLLCPRCRHAERERLRYQQDPRYRARRLAYSAARYRRSQAMGRRSED